MFGATCAFRLKNAGKKCLVIDRRTHSGGNVYCAPVEGIHVHQYGAHIFHTSDKRIWDFVNAIVPFNRYTNSPLACYKGSLYNLPFNMNTFYQMWGVRTPEEARRIIDAQRLDVEVPANLEEQALKLVGRDIYEKLVKEYTEKQWGRPCTELPPFIIKRLPVRFVYDNNYFNDAYQGIPVGGYNRLIDGLLSGVEVKLGADFFADRTYWESVAEKIIYTGPIDAFFNYRFGKLSYRTVRFETEVLATPNYQGNAVINYTSHEQAFTRIIEHKHFELFGQDVYSVPNTVISKEFSTEWKEGMEPFYPVNDEVNSSLYLQYKELADREERTVFGGRLAEYKYYDMAPVIARALDMNLD